MNKTSEREKYSIVFINRKQKVWLSIQLIVWLMGFGPGMVIANSPELIGGKYPLLWFWWIGWFIAWCCSMYMLFYKTETIKD